MKTFSTMALTGALAGSMLLVTGGAAARREDDPGGIRHRDGDDRGD